MSRVGEIRKIRSDKKHDVKPFVPFELYDCILRLSYITRMPIKDVCELLVVKGARSLFVLDHVSMYFIRDYSPEEGLIYIAQAKNYSRRLKITDPKERLSLRLKQNDYKRIDTLSYVTGLTIASITSLILTHAFRDVTLLENIITDSKSMLDNNRSKERRYILKKATKGKWMYDLKRI
ncbi:hypothetical protein [Ornithinibacillus sp. JPR2-1]|uniref:hypothetical protein n=1 Tax=Ornithinibacillus sp. JPR2-1 TaxID=2094019 RepID=UPI0031DAD99D